MRANYFTRLKDQFSESELSLVAAALAFSTVLALVPFLAVSLAILQKLGGLESFYPKVQKLILSNFSETVGSDGIRIMKESIGRMLSAKLGALGALFLLVTTTRVVYDMDNAIHKVWKLRNDRRLLQRIVFYWLFILVFPFGLATYTALISMKDANATFVNLAMLIFILYSIYKLMPNCHVQKTSAGVGAISGAILVYSIHKIFVYFTQKVFNYGKLYGGIASFPIFLLWILLIWYAILIGAMISASFKHSRTQVLSKLESSP